MISKRFCGLCSVIFPVNRCKTGGKCSSQPLQTAVGCSGCAMLSLFVIFSRPVFQCQQDDKNRRYSWLHGSIFSLFLYVSSSIAEDRVFRSTCCSENKRKKSPFFLLVEHQTCDCYTVSDTQKDFK